MLDILMSTVTNVDGTWKKTWRDDVRKCGTVCTASNNNNNNVAGLLVNNYENNNSNNDNNNNNCF